MNYLFIIQGEGRGHMTQALALSQILRNHGHRITRVIVGKSNRRSIPGFFTEKIAAPIESMQSPNFVTDKNQKSVNLLKTIVYSLIQSPKYARSIKRINEIVKADQPDVIINFYEFLGGLYNFVHRPKAKFICIAHQFLLSHKDFVFPEGRKMDRVAMSVGNRIASLGAVKKLCLSFQYFEDMPKKNLFVVPPLLREEVKKIKAAPLDHYLVYMVNHGYSAEVDQYHHDNPNQPLFCFWDKNNAPVSLAVDKTLTYHQLDDQLFLQKMASCKGYVTTAGFESVCEAMYLDKPVLMVPVEGHYEQACNAIDAQKAGAGITSAHFNIQKLQDYLHTHQSISKKFQPWANSAEKAFIYHLQ